MNDARPWALYAGGKDKTMFDEFKSGDKIAEEKFRVTLPDDGTVIHYTVTLEKSGAFAYGNQTCVTVHDDYPGTWDGHYDTRYTKECSTVEGFRAWAFDFLKKGLRPDALIERDNPAFARFEVGKTYDANDRSFDPITVIKRTAKCIYVENVSGNVWRMTIKRDEKAEFVVDSSFPVRARELLTFRADHESK